MRECLWLVSNGVPFDTAFSLDQITRTGWAIIFSEQKTGSKFNWQTMSFGD